MTFSRTGKLGTNEKLTNDRSWMLQFISVKKNLIFCKLQIRLMFNMSTAVFQGLKQIMLCNRRLFQTVVKKHQVNNFHCSYVGFVWLTALSEFTYYRSESECNLVLPSIGLYRANMEHFWCTLVCIRTCFCIHIACFYL